MASKIEKKRKKETTTPTTPTTTSTSKIAQLKQQSAFYGLHWLSCIQHEQTLYFKIKYIIRVCWHNHYPTPILLIQFFYSLYVIVVILLPIYQIMVINECNGCTLQKFHYPLCHRFVWYSNLNVKIVKKERKIIQSIFLIEQISVEVEQML